MKYSFETEPQETTGILQLFSHLITIVEKAQKRQHKLNKKRLDLEKERLAFEKQKWEDALEIDEDEDSEEDFTPVLKFENPTKVKKPKKENKQPPSDDVIEEKTTNPTPISGNPGQWNEPKELTDHQKLGKKLLTQMVESWLVNWRADGEQPNRFELLHDLAIDGKEGGAVVSYCMVVKGLSMAVHNILMKQAIFDGTKTPIEDLEPIPNPHKSRVLAGNITQVASCVFSQLADQYQYPNPLQHFYNLKEIKNEFV